jgi:hypothetical protein
MNTDRPGSFLKKNTKGKTVISLSKTPAHKADSYSQAIPEIPPSPPFSKGGWKGFQRFVAERKIS